MPELPEVETIANRLRSGWNGQPPLINQSIKAANLMWARTLAEPDQDSFISRIQTQSVQDIRRRGKYIIFDLDIDHLLIHLRMSGDLIVQGKYDPPGHYDRLVIYFQSGYRLAFQDMRKFGRVWLVQDPQTVLHSLGPEPLDETFTAQVFFQSLIARHRQLKPLLLDQTFIAGLGNIYVDEALHLSKIHPLTLSDSLEYSRAEGLLQNIRRVLRQGIQRQGTTIDWIYRGGGNQEFLRVYQRSGEPCPECGESIQRIVVGQRGTHICPHCQILDTH